MTDYVRNGSFRFGWRISQPTLGLIASAITAAGITALLVSFDNQLLFIF